LFKIHIKPILQIMKPITTIVQNQNKHPLCKSTCPFCKAYKSCYGMWVIKWIQIKTMINFSKTLHDESIIKLTIFIIYFRLYFCKVTCTQIIISLKLTPKIFIFPCLSLHHHKHLQQNKNKMETNNNNNNNNSKEWVYMDVLKYLI
jgi:hypothetical protein